MKVILTGGGTAGHIMPNLALLPDLKKSFSEIAYIGGDGMEKKIVPPILPFFEIPVVKLTRSLTPKNLLIPVKLAQSVSAAKAVLRSEAPDVVFSKGGYVGLPVVIAARRLGIPAVVHESDMSLGLANRISARYASYVCTAFPGTARRLDNGVYTGTPIRRELAHGSKQKAYAECGFAGAKPVLLVTGGSLGARFLNDLVRDNLEQLCQTFDVIHLCGKGNLDPAKKRSGYFQCEFCDHMQDFYAAADYVVSRAGANTINELAFLQKPALLIPLPKGNSRGDQIENAREFESRGLALMLEQKDAGHFVSAVSKLRREEARLLRSLGKLDVGNAAAKIADILVDCAKSQS